MIEKDDEQNPNVDIYEDQLREFELPPVDIEEIKMPNVLPPKPEPVFKKPSR